MLNIQLARKYGTAIFEIANEDNKLEEYGRELADVSQALFAQAELKDFLTNPQIQPEDKKQVLLRLLKDQVSPMMMNFLLLLVEGIGLNEYLGQFLGLFVYGAVNFLMNKKITFRGGY